MRILEVLLVEDNEGDVEMSRRAFAKEATPPHLSAVNDGLEAIEFLEKRGRHLNAPTPHLIILDLNMPRMNGKEFLEHIKVDPKLKMIPVVMFTSSESPNDLLACYERQASAYVVKPFNAKDFTQALRQIVQFWSTVSSVPG